jgi:iron(III) transport system permease protein
LATVSASAVSWSVLPRQQLAIGLAIFALVALVTVAPVLVVVFGAFAKNAWYETFVGNAVNRSAIGYSFLLALRAPVAALIGFLIAWLLIRIRLPGGRFIEFSMWVSFFVPILPVTLSWILLLNPRYGLINEALKSLPFVHGPVFNIYSVGGILWVHIVASSVPVMVVLLGPAIRQLDASFEEVGRVCGSGPFAVFRNITLPILAPVILTGTLAGFIKSLEAFEVEQLLGRPSDIYVYSTRIYDLASWEPPNFAAAMALSTFVLFILLFIAIAYQRLNTRNDYATILGRGASFRQLQIGWTRWLLSAALFLMVAISLFCPLAMLVCGSFMKLFGFFHIPSPYTLVHWREVLGDPIFLSALTNSLMLSIGAGVGGVFAYAVVAYLIVRSPLPGRAIVDLLAWLPWSIPGILLGVALLWTFLQTRIFLPIYGTIYLLMIAMVIKSMPFGTQMIKSVLIQLGSDLEEASKVCGGTWLHTFRRVILPLAMPALITVGLVGFISSARDISTVVLLGSGKSRTLSLLMLDFAAGAEFEKATVVAVIIVALVVGAALLARVLGGHVGIRE